MSPPYNHAAPTLCSLRLLVREAFADSRRMIISGDSCHSFSFLPKRYNTENTFLLVNLSNDFYIAKSARISSSAGDRLRQEIKWYENAYTKALKIVSYCPEYIGSFVENGELVLVLKFIQNALTMREALISYRLPIGEAVNIIKDLFEVLELEVDRYGPLEEGQLHNSFRNRIWARAALIQRIFSNYEGGINYWDTGTIVNGLPATTLAEVFQWLNSYSHYLMAPMVPVRGHAHGDLHFENILIQQNGKCFLVDPNYEVNAIPIYDLGKLVQSICGLYDLIHNGNFTIECSSAREIRLSFPGESPAIFREIASHLHPLFDLITNDKELTVNLLEQADVMCLAHFFCLIPHHAKDETKLLALIARTITLFHEVI